MQRTNWLPGSCSNDDDDGNGNDYGDGKNKDEDGDDDKEEEEEEDALFGAIKPLNNHRPVCVGMSFLCTISRPSFYSVTISRPYFFFIHHILFSAFAIVISRPYSTFPISLPYFELLTCSNQGLHLVRRLG